MSAAVTLEQQSPTDSQAPRRQRAPRAAKPAEDKRPKATTKVSLWLSPEVIRRLRIAAVGLNSDMSKVAEQVFAEAPTLRRFVLSDRKGSPDPGMLEVSAS